MPNIEITDIARLFDNPSLAEALLGQFSIPAFEGKIPWGNERDLVTPKELYDHLQNRSNGQLYSSQRLRELYRRSVLFSRVPKDESSTSQNFAVGSRRSSLDDYDGANTSWGRH